MSAKVNLPIEQGATFRKTVTYKTGDPATPVDLTGCTARAQFRQKLTSAEPLLELTTENNRIVLGGTAGTVAIVISADDTASFTWESAVYDLELVFADGTVKRLLHGSVTVDPEVTR